MTYDERCEWLKGYKYSTLKIEQLEDEINTIRLGKMYPSIAPDDGMPHAHNITDLSDYAAKIDDLLLEIRAELDKSLRKRHEIVQAIERIEGKDAEIYKLILRYRYIHLTGCKLMSWEKIAVKADYSYDYVKHLHQEAVKAMDR